MARLSVIIPTLNEAAAIGQLLGQLQTQTCTDLEIIVTDGGSSDDTLDIAREAGVKTLAGPAGRGRQMNLGARSANGDLLLFLHADSELTSNAQLENALEFLAQADEKTAGHFPLRFQSDNVEVLERLRYFECKTELNRPGTFNGDQGLLIWASAWRLLGGFSEQHGFLEDRDFGDRFVEYGSFVTLPDPLLTSARRFEQEGVRERVLLNIIILGMYQLGCDEFFRQAPEIYRETAGTRLNPRPFLRLARQSLMADGWLTALARYYRLGRYANHNLWQLFLRLGLRLGKPETWLRFCDSYMTPLTRNPLGNALAALGVLAWFFTIRFRHDMPKDSKLSSG